ncbi:hypothetical protein DNU06_05620 [Putridiphycobacter roseus]|uniref:Alginate export domain-containing protein n=1 Tax=Putridiphycobacter roseus TaxID=2219161 RepID=A0A2W1N2L5_9FLAO|nr:alginate export family protein [Putridiphycobacter roseus]PZE18094.1 hypothetical protein DNU06_05620 [Putridiphycobacter roseus]
MKKTALIFAILLLNNLSLFSQDFKLSAEIRPRFEARHGYKKLMSNNQKTASFVSQRTRLNFEFEQDKIAVKVTAQNVRVWGDVSTLSAQDINGITMHETWAKYQFNEMVALKVGRQEIAYDDERIFGAVGWAQQARSHDAALVKLDFKRKGKLDAGFAYNSNNENITDPGYFINQYQNMQFLWYQVPLAKSFKLSLLVLNNGMQYSIDNVTRKTAYSQTMGGRLVYKKNKIAANAAFYYQLGELPQTISTGTVIQNAYYVAADIQYRPTSSFTFGGGIEILSGNDMSSTSSQNNAFNPYYGTNHKFNGLMDYFYVGNHLNTVGLVDIYVPLTFKKDKLKISTTAHYFLTQNNYAIKVIDYLAILDPSLGTEIDLTVNYKLSNVFEISAGYSQFFGTQSLETIQGGNASLSNNWSWLMLTFKPVLFQTNLK